MLDVVFLISEKLGGIVMDGDGCDFVANSVELTAAFAGVVFTGNFFDDIHAVGNLTKYGMAVVEKRSGGGGDEELRSVGSWTSICHGENTWSTMTKIRMEFIRKLVTGTSAAAFCGIATLQHEAFNDTVEGNIFVVTTLREVEEVRASDRGFRCIKGCVNIACGGVECNFNIVHDRGKSLTPGWWGNLSSHPSHISCIPKRSGGVSTPEIESISPTYLIERCDTV